jgi:hypothetical protein
MKNKLIIIAIFTVLASCLMTACQTSTTVGNNAAVNSSANKTPDNTNRENVNSAANQTKTENQNPVQNDTSGNSPTTPTAAYKAAYAARKNKDIKALKQLMAKDMFEFFEILGEGSPNPVDEGLKQLCEQPQVATDEVRNEKITGDKATLQYLDKDGAWKTMDLVKEDGAWKLTIGKMDGDKKSK